MSDSETPPYTRGRAWSVWRWLLVGQVFVVVTLWVGISVTTQIPHSREWLDVLFFVLLVWQCEILGFWAGLGQSWHRFAVIAVAAPALGLMGSYAVGTGELIEFQIFCLGVFGVVAITTGLLRRFAGSLQRLELGDADREALRFGIQHVMIWTAVLAVVFSGFRYLLQLGIGRGGVNGLFEIFLLACCMSFCTVAAVWAIMGTQILVSRMVGMLLVTGVAVTLTQFLSREWTFTFATLFSQVLMWSTLGLLRADGYRFLRRSPT